MTDYDLFKHHIEVGKLQLCDAPDEQVNWPVIELSLVPVSVNQRDIKPDR